MSRDMCLLHSVIVGEKSYDRCCIIHMETDTSTAWQHATQHGMLGVGGRVFHCSLFWFQRSTLAKMP